MKNGYENEFDFINSLNNKRFYEVGYFFQKFLKNLYPNIKGNDVIKAYKYGRYAKVDMVIDVLGIKKGISIKCGYKNSVHVEPIDKFILYLKMHNFKYLDELLRYLYSDGTNDNTGSIRLSSSEYKGSHEGDIELINTELEKIKKDLLIRFLIKTDVNYKINVDAFIVGYTNDFIWATKDEVINYLMNFSKKFIWCSYK